MRSLLALSALVLAAAVVALVLARDDASAPVRTTGAVSLVGDSLNVGIEPYLEQELAGWRISTDDVVGRSTDAGIAALESAGPGLARVVVVSLGTNDPQADADGFRANVRRVLDVVGDRRCVVWATIWRGGANEAFNGVLAEVAGDNRRLVLVEWDAMVESAPELLAADGVHGTPDGYARRARAVAEAVRRCPIGTTVEAGS